MNFRFSYPRDLAQALVDRLARTDVPEPFRALSPLPSLAQMETLLDVAYAASLQEEEGRPIAVAIAWVDRAEAVRGPTGLLPLREPLELTPETVRRLAPAVEPKRGYLLAGPTESGGAEVWGLLHFHLAEELKGSVPALVVHVIRPGTLRIRHIVDDLYLLTEGTSLELLGSDHARRLLELMTGILDPAYAAPPPSPAALTLLRLALSMLEHGHGGMILVAPHGPIQGIVARFRIEPPRTQLLTQALSDTKAADIEATALRGKHAWEATLSRRRQAGEQLFGVEAFVGQLTAVDGALLLAPDLELLAFGVIVEAHDKDGALLHIVDPLDENNELTLPLARADLGTRHQSAVRFCFQNPGAIALVASQDRTLSFCTKLAGAGEVLLLRPYSMDVGALR